MYNETIRQYLDVEILFDFVFTIDKVVPNKVISKQFYFIILILVEKLNFLQSVYSV